MADSPFIARPSDLAALEAYWAEVKGGASRFVRVVAPSGGGRRAALAETLRRVRSGGDDVILWRVSCSDAENGAQWLIRMYGSLVGAIVQDVLLRGKVEMVLNGQLPREVKRVQDWFQSFVGALKEAKPDANGQMQLRMTQDNPLIGLVEVVHAISRRIPIVLELQQPYYAASLLLTQFLEALHTEVSKDGKVLVLLHDEPEGEIRQSTHPAPLLDLYTRRAEGFPAVVLAPWGAPEVEAYLAAQGKQGDAAALARIGQGRPALIADLIELLAADGRLGGDLSSVNLGDLAPMAVDVDELDLPEGPPKEGERKHVGPEEAERVAFFAALLGVNFPAALVAEMGGYEKDSVDDLLDAMGGLFEEQEYQEQMGTWIYRFAKPVLREAVLARNTSEESRDLARRVGVFFERFLAPRGLAYVQRAARIFGEFGAPRRAEGMRALALTQDDPNAWGLAYELIRWFDDVPWTDATRRTIYFTLLDNLAASGTLTAADRVHGEITDWATKAGDRDLQGWLLLNGSKLDLRRQDLYRARDRARDALSVFEGLGNGQRKAEVHAQLAAIELADGKPEEALKAAEAALAASVVEAENGQKVVPPQIAAHAEMVRGAVARRTNKAAEAVEHYKRANEIAGNTGLGAIALDAGLAMGEALIASGKPDEGRDVLVRVLTTTRQLGQVGRERQAADLLIQLEASRRNFQGALQLAQRNLQISQQTRTEAALVGDLYNVAFFHLAQNQGPQALPFFQQAEAALKGATHPIQRDLYYHAGLSALQAQKTDVARTYLEKALPLSRASRDARKTVTTLDALAALVARAGEKEAARAYLTEAVGICDQAELKDEKRTLAKRLESLDEA